MANYSGDIPSNLDVGAEKSVRLNRAETGYESIRLDYESYSFSLPSPTTGNTAIMVIPTNAEFTQIAGLTTGSNTPRVWLNINKTSSPSSQGTAIMSADYGISGAGGYTTTFSSPSVTAEDWLILYVNAISGTVTNAEITLVLKKIS